ncbi:MAG TPA: transglycosylase SLT domain-containing protein, partial [Candidatus Dormibacteraeota bacterium]|nr:transglycosylase SLT domain-containing protein [Candidatus Dormibacteraeota bacterium]
MALAATALTATLAAPSAGAHMTPPRAVARPRPQQANGGVLTAASMADSEHADVVWQQRLAATDNKILAEQQRRQAAAQAAAAAAAARAKAAAAAAAAQAAAQRSAAQQQTTAAPAVSVPAGSVQQDIVNAFTPLGSAAVQWGLRIADCESTYNPRAVNPSGAEGLFQFMPSTFAGT